MSADALHADVDAAVGRIEGDPDAIAEHSRQLSATAAGMHGLAQRLAGTRAGAQASWSGPAGMSFASACYTREEAARMIAGQLNQTAGLLAAFASQRRAAQQRLRRAKQDAREAQQRAREAKRELEQARNDADEARSRAAGAAAQIKLRAMEALPYDDLIAELHAAYAAADQAEERARRAQRELERAQDDFRQALERAEEAREDAEESDRLAGAAIAAMADALAPPPPPPAPVAPAPEDEDQGNFFTGLGKGLEDVGGELADVGGGIVRHVDPFHPGRTWDQWQSTASTGAYAVTHPGDTASGVWHSFADPIVESYEHGGLDEALSRGLVSGGAALVGGKGLTKLGKLRGGGGDGDGEVPVESRADLDVPESPPYVRDTLPPLRGTEAAAFADGRYETREMRAGSRFYRSEGADSEHAGRWLGDEPARTKGGAEALYNVLKWDNPLEVMREYRLRHDLTLYWGDVAGGTGRQGFVPPDIPKEHLDELLQRTNEWELP